MKKGAISIMLTGLLVCGNVLAMDAGHDMGGNKAVSGENAGGMDHSQMQHGESSDGKTFKKAVMVDGVHAEFQVMELAAMNMKDPEGRSHHVMASFTKNGEKIVKAAGKIKVIAPSGKEQTETLKDFGSGVFASNFTIDEAGKWGIICLFKEEGGTHTAKFWYTHHKM